MPVNDWKELPSFEASLGEIVKLYQCPKCLIWVKGKPNECPNCGAAGAVSRPEK